MPVRSYEPLGAPKPILSEEEARLLAKAATQQCGVEVKFLAHAGDPVVHFHVDLHTNQLKAIPQVLEEGAVQLEMPSGDLTEIYRAAETSSQDLAA